MSLSTLLLVGALLTCVRPSLADTLNFDDLTTYEASVPSGYHGLNFTTFDVTTLSFAGTFGYSGYVNGTVSPSSAIFNVAGFPASFSAAGGGTLTLNSFYLTSAINDGLNVVVTGSMNGVVQDTATFTVSTFGPTLETLDWTDIDTVGFVSSGGTHDAAAVKFVDGSEQFILDNVTVDEAVASGVTPEPSSFALLGTGLLGLAGVTRKRFA